MFLIGKENIPGFVMCMGIALTAALLLGILRARKAGLSGSRIAAAALLAPLLALILSHLLHGLVTLEDTLYSHSPWYLFAFWERGGTLTGGLLGAVLALALAGGKHRAKLLECCAPSLALMLAASALGTGFMGQGYGEYLWEESFFWRFPFMMYDADYEGWAWALFLLETLVALILFLLLLCKKPLWQGENALLLIGLFFSARILLESLRRDEYLRWGFVRVEELFAGLWILAVLILYCRKAKGRVPSKIACFAIFAGMIVLILLLEFATEGRIPFLRFLDETGCYIAMALCCAIVGGCVVWMRALTRNHERRIVK